MEKEVYALQYEVEKEHWWFVARLQIILQYLARKQPPHPSFRLLDVGCGTGAVLEALAKRYDAHGIDVSADAVEFCRQRGLTNMHVGTLNDIDANESYDLMTFFDVVEHVVDDVRLLSNAHRLLKDNGGMLITVPAFPSLWSHHDEVLHHKRRYTKNRLRSLVEDAGFEIKHMTFFNTLLFPIAVAKRFIAKVLGSKEANDLEVPGPMINQFLKAVFSVERLIVPSMSLPFGLSLLCWARKKTV